MLHKIGLGLLSITMFLSASAYALESQVLQQDIAIEIKYEFPADKPQILDNFLFWPVEASCKITTEDTSNEFLIVALAKKGKINDIPLSAGQSLRLVVHNDENLKISADAGAKVQITNFGQHTVKATCTA